MKLRILAVALSMWSMSVGAAECYQISVDGKVWSNESICVDSNPDKTSEVVITLNLGLGETKTTIAKYYLNSLPSGAGSAYGISAVNSFLIDASTTINIDDLNGYLILNGKDYVIRPL